MLNITYFRLGFWANKGRKSVTITINQCCTHSAMILTRHKIYGMRFTGLSQRNIVEGKQATLNK